MAKDAIPEGMSFLTYRSHFYLNEVTMLSEKPHEIGDSRCPAGAVCRYSNTANCPNLPNGCRLSEQSKKL